MAETINYDELTARQKKKYNKLLEKKKKTAVKESKKAAKEFNKSQKIRGRKPATDKHMERSKKHAISLAEKETDKAMAKKLARNKAIKTAAKFGLKALGSPYLAAIDVALSPSTLNKGEDEAVRKRNEEWAKKEGIQRASGGTVKNYANGGGVRKAKFTDS